ncbi:hypothetical protein [Streptomyces sp. CB02959]|uniref:hypothetical protein n=1 Tax=Streptomyces sp. CB02959 TaxID=2020330 RepID=UPI000CB00FA8|nr:hypothetical protein [Streptomyces sp. CB02959]PJN40253.1 hypothetical protein CG747_14525 [Streptomyces sp. CB02959]
MTATIRQLTPADDSKCTQQRLNAAHQCSGDLVTARGMEIYAHMHSAIGLALGLGNHFGVKVIR